MRGTTHRIANYTTLLRASHQWRMRSSTAPHMLPSRLIVSLTSYPKRFESLHLTLKCLLSQSVAPDLVVLWVARDDAPLLPRDVTALERIGLSIRETEDLRSYKKIIPALREYPGSFIVTADDDVFYDRNWLKRILSSYKNGERPEIVAHRAHAVTYDESGNLRPYRDWNFDVAETGGIIVPTGVGGVLYSPNSLAPEVLNIDAFQRLCPNGDDIWLAWMGHIAGSVYRKVPGRYNPPTWKGSQEVALWKRNLEGGENDVQIANMISAYGSLGAPMRPIP